MKFENFDKTDRDMFCGAEDFKTEPTSPLSFKDDYGFFVLDSTGINVLVLDENGRGEIFAYPRIFTSQEKALEFFEGFKFESVKDFCPDTHGFELIGTI